MASVNCKSMGTKGVGLGVYIPAGRVRLADRARRAGISKRVPLDRITGIEQVAVVEAGEFAIDMAQIAAERCLASAGVAADQVDLLISCSICRYDEPENGVVFEPSTAVRLRSRLGTYRATAFDVSNACAGMATGISVADDWIRSGVCRSALVVSGEYISHMADCAEKEIEGLTDPRLACLTLGDGAAAVLLVPSADPTTGLLRSQLYTVPCHSGLCIAKPTDAGNGGAIMLTDSKELTKAMFAELRDHFRTLLHGRHDCLPRWVIPHQTSRIHISDAAKEINESVGIDVCTPRSLIDNLSQRGNTASTSHFIAMHEAIVDGRIQNHDSVLVSVNASGLTVGSLLFEVGQLPSAIVSGSVTALDIPAEQEENPSTVDIRGVGTSHSVSTSGGTSFESFKRAISYALCQAELEPRDIDLLLWTGVYREDYIMEPSMAALLAGECDLGDRRVRKTGHDFLSFDVFGGAGGFLHACGVAKHRIATGRARNVLIVTGDSDPSRADGAHQRPAIGALAGAVILSEKEGLGLRFGRTRTSASWPATGGFTAYYKHQHGRPSINSKGCLSTLEQSKSMVTTTINNLLVAESVRPEEVDRCYVSSSVDEWTPLLRDAGLNRCEVIAADTNNGRLITSSLPAALQAGLALSGREPGISLLIAFDGSPEVVCTLCRSHSKVVPAGQD